MSTVQERPPGATHPTVQRVDLADPDARSRWLAVVHEHTEDAIAAGLDATARHRARVLSRAEARRKIRAARRSLEALFAAAGDAPAMNVAPRDV